MRHHQFWVLEHGWSICGAQHRPLSLILCPDRRHPPIPAFLHLNPDAIEASHTLKRPTGQTLPEITPGTLTGNWQEWGRGSECRWGEWTRVGWSLEQEVQATDHRWESFHRGFWSPSPCMDPAEVRAGWPAIYLDCFFAFPGLASWWLLLPSKLHLFTQGWGAGSRA